MAASSVPGLRLSEPKYNIFTAREKLLSALLIYQVLFPFPWVKFCPCTGAWLAQAGLPPPIPCSGPLSQPTPGDPRGLSVHFISLCH